MTHFGSRYHPLFVFTERGRQAEQSHQIRRAVPGGAASQITD